MMNRLEALSMLLAVPLLATAMFLLGPIGWVLGVENPWSIWRELRKVPSLAVACAVGVITGRVK